MSKCIVGGCKKQATYGIPGEKTPFSCQPHAEPGMIDIRNPKCIKCNKVRPTYNIPGEKKGIYCKLCAKPGMIDVFHGQCIEKGCTNRPYYNFKDKKKPIYCQYHFKKDMVYLGLKQCQENGCELYPNYNLPDQISGIYCKKHKKEGMEDVTHPKCQEPGCKKQASCNIKGNTELLYCSEHKKLGMTNVKSKLCKCGHHPTFNFPGEFPAICCFNCKKDGMVDVKHSKCLTPLCDTRTKPKYKGYCLRCFIYTFPDEPITRNYKTKEQAVVDYIKTKFSNENWITDKPIQGGESKRRPDMFLDKEKYCIILEIDENGHQPYENICENRRTMELSKDVKHKPSVFIRINPDSYIDAYGIKHKSCWITNKNGICIVDKNKKEEWNNRLNKLRLYIKYWLNAGINPQIPLPDKTITVESLFYDEPLIQKYNPNIQSN